MIIAVAPLNADKQRAGRAGPGRLFQYAPTRRAALLFLLTAPVWLVSSSTTGFAVAIVVTLLSALLVIIDALAVPGPSLVRLKRDVPETLGLGHEAEVRLEIGIDWPLALDVEVHDALARSIVHAAPRDAVLPWFAGRIRLASRGSGELGYPIRGIARGVHELGVVALRIRGPLGLARRTLEFRPADRIAVVPSIAGVRRFRLLALQHRLREAGVRTIRRRGEGSSFSNLRDYVEGDDPRRVDWKATARRGKLISREYSVEQGQTIMIVIDAGRMMTQLSDGVARFEHALAAATVLADVAIRSGDLVGLLAFNDEVRAFVPPARGGFTLARIRDAMVPLEATVSEPDYASAFRTLAARMRKRSLIVLFTDVVDPRSSRALIAHTARTASRHLPLVVALQNQALATAALPRDAGENDFYESAAAEELLLEREDALTRMRRAGASVLDVAPRNMTAAVINRYLAIKSRSAL
jgi:uncharacterized protein (DUF58 family)